MANIINGRGRVGVRQPSGNNGTTTTTTSTGPSYLLDTYGGAAAAYSLRKLNSSYSGPAIRVRRSSDNTETNIGFDGSGNLDEAALTAFVGAGNGSVTIWYDQSGNDRNIARITAIDQPRIVSSGNIETDSSKPSVNFDGYKPMTYPTGFSYSAAAILGKVTTQNLINYIVGGYSSGADNGLYYNGTLAGGNLFGSFDGTNSVYQNIGDLNRNLGWFNMKLSNMYISKNNGALFNGTHANSIIFGGNTLNGLGGRDVGWDGLFFKGKIQEAIFWSSEQSANESGIKSNINTYYSIY